MPDERRDLRGELENFDGEYPPSKILEVGEILVGEILRWETGTTVYGPAPICVLADEETGEEVSLWILYHVLYDEFRKLQPRTGERIGVKRLPDSEKGYHRFAVRIDREEGPGSNLDRFPPPGDVPPEDLDKVATGRRALETDDDLPF